MAADPSNSRDSNTVLFPTPYEVRTFIACTYEFGDSWVRKNLTAISTRDYSVLRAGDPVNCRVSVREAREQLKTMRESLFRQRRLGISALSEHSDDEELSDEAAAS